MVILIDHINIEGSIHRLHALGEQTGIGTVHSIRLKREWDVTKACLKTRIKEESIVHIGELALTLGQEPIAIVTGIEGLTEGRGQL